MTTTAATAHIRSRAAMTTAAAATTVDQYDHVAAASRSFRDKLILVFFALVRVYAWPRSAYYPCQRLGA